MSEGWRMSAKKKGLSFPTERSSSNGGRRVAGLPSKVWVLLQFYTKMGGGGARGKQKLDLRLHLLCGLLTLSLLLLKGMKNKGVGVKGVSVWDIGDGVSQQCECNGPR